MDFRNDNDWTTNHSRSIIFKRNGHWLYHRFLVQQMGWKASFIVCCRSAHNLIIIPIFIGIAVISVSFSLQLIKKLFTKSFYQPFAPMLVRYFMFLGVALIFIGIAAFIEGYLTPYFMKAILSI